MTNGNDFPARAGKVAGGCLTAAGALAALVFLWFLYQGLSGQRSFDSWLEIVIYYAIPGGVAALLSSAVTWPPLARLRGLLAVIALTLSLFAAELALTVAGSARSEIVAVIDEQPQLRPVMSALADGRDRTRDAAALTKKFGNPIDARTAADVLADLRRTGVEAVPIVTPSNHLFVARADSRIDPATTIDGRGVMPLAGVSSRVTLLCNENGPWVHYRSDRHGFNNPDEVWQSARLEIAALGDSFAHGYCVPGGASFVDLIRKRHPSTLNLGIAGDGPLLMLATLEEYLPSLAPGTVLWFYYEGNDLTDLQLERRSPILTSYLRGGFTQPELTRQEAIDRAILSELPRLAADEARRSRARSRTPIVATLIAFAKLTAVRERLAPLAATDPLVARAAADFEGENLAVFRDVLRQARSRVEAWNGRLYFVYLPEWARYTRYRSWGKDKREAVMSVVRDLGIPAIDVEPRFQAHGDPLSLFPFRSAGHYTEAGHRVVAEEVLRRLAAPRPPEAR